MLKKGLVQIYTGDGKGKTSAALGLALRTSGRYNNVLFYQFLKPSSLDLGEKIAIEKMDETIVTDALDMPWNMAKSFDKPKTVKKMKAAIAGVMEKIAIFAQYRKYDVIILDELAFCQAKGLADIEDIKKILKGRDKHVEIVMTGRGATPELIELADLVTEMKQIKHPYEKNIKARKGIEF
jgi:cob(I)alamin adenosyltransferase